MEKIKVIFLDIDGVLNCKNTLYFFRGCFGIDPYLVRILKRIISATNAKIVLSSTWRLDDPFREEIKRHGIDFLDITPKLDSIRGEEIKSWLENHPEVEQYIILDDDSDFLEEQPLFQTSWDTGLTEKIADDAINYLLLT